MRLLAPKLGVVLASIAFGLLASCALPGPARVAAIAPTTLGVEDAAVLSAVLEALSARELKAEPQLEIATESIPTSSGFADYLVSHPRKNCGALTRFREALRKNEAAVRIAGLPATARWRLAAPTEDTAANRLQRARGRMPVRVGVPAYAPDGRSALVMVSFPWSAYHVASGEFVVEKDGGWRVTCSDVGYGL